jgi:SAM-dependent methyltransferase
VPLAREVDYWEGVAAKTVPDSGFVDNTWKRPHQLRRLLEYPWINENVLEVGVGNGIIAGLMLLTVGGHWKYLGTDLSEKFCRSAKERFNLKTVQADVREIPGEGYTRIIAFDSLEHVRPEHRAEGYRRMYEVAAPGALLFIHYSYSQSFHDKEFDHPFGVKDIADLEDAGFSLLKYERFDCQGQTDLLDYAFLVMRK